MSDRRGMMPRDDRRRDDDRDHRRRRSRSPRGGRRDDHEADSYSSSRGYREREREERYGRGGGGGRGEWDRDRRGGRREGERRRDDRRRDFDDRNDRRGYGREDRHDNRQRRDDRDMRMDREDERQLERQGRRSQSPRPRQARQPTPDLTNVTPISQRQRRTMRFGIRHVDYQNFGGEKAKLTGMFPLPGAPRQQPMDRQRLKDFMDQHSTTNSSALKPSTARQSKRLFVYNIPASTTETMLVDFINLQLNGLNITRGTNPCTTAQLSADKSFAMLEFKTSEDATHAMALDGISMDSDYMGNNESNGDAYGSERGISIQRPKDYIVPYVTDDTQNEAGVLSDIVPDTQNKICIANIPVFLGEDQIHELLSSFGELKSFVLAKDTSSGQSRGIAFCEYKNAAESTDIAVDGLNNMELGDLHLRVKRASIGVEQKAADMSVSAMSAMAGSNSNGASHHGRVLCLLNMVTPEDLMDPDEADEILGDVEEECAKFGTVLGVKMPRPVAGKQIPGVGKIYVKFETSSMAQQALKALAGRQFSHRTVVATYFGEDYFDVDAF